MFRASFEKLRRRNKHSSKARDKSVTAGLYSIENGRRIPEREDTGRYLSSAQNLGQATEMLQKRKRQWLKNHLEQCPQNQSDVDAIEDALNCQSMGVLTSIKPNADAIYEWKVVAGKVLVIYKHW